MAVTSGELELSTCIQNAVEVLPEDDFTTYFVPPPTVVESSKQEVSCPDLGHDQ